MLKNICPKCVKEYSTRNRLFCVCGESLVSAYDHEVEGLASKYRELGADSIASHFTKNLENVDSGYDNYGVPPVGSSIGLNYSQDASKVSSSIERKIYRSRVTHLIYIIVSVVLVFVYGALAWKSTKKRK